MSSVPAKPHVCEDSWLRVQRLVFVLVRWDTDSYDLVASELGNCSHCLRNALNAASGSTASCARSRWSGAAARSP